MVSTSYLNFLRGVEYGVDLFEGVWQRTWLLRYLKSSSGSGTGDCTLYAQTSSVVPAFYKRPNLWVIKWTRYVLLTNSYLVVNRIRDDQLDASLWQKHSLVTMAIIYIIRTRKKTTYSFLLTHSRLTFSDQTRKGNSNGAWFWTTLTPLLRLVAMYKVPAIILT
jgi:hypothetical protein